VTADEKSIRDLVDRWHRATAEGDVDTVLSLMSEDVEFLVPGRDPLRGRAAFGEGLRTLLKAHRIQSSGDVHDVQVSGDLAVALTRLSVRVIALASDEEISRSGYALSVFNRIKGRWLLVRDANLLPPPKA